MKHRFLYKDVQGQLLIEYKMTKHYYYFVNLRSKENDLGT